MKESLEGFLSGLPAERRSRAKLLQKSGAKIAYWRSDKDGRPSNGGVADPAEPGVIQKVDGPLSICTKRALHATYTPGKWKGDRIWLVALIGEVQEQEDKLASLEREIIAGITPGTNP
jgi:hypothetical protein